MSQSPVVRFCGKITPILHFLTVLRPVEKEQEDDDDEKVGNLCAKKFCWCGEMEVCMSA